MATDAADGQKLASRLSLKPPSRGSPSDVVVKSLAEIKREKVRRMQQRPTAADDALLKTSEPAQRKQRDSKIKLYTPPGDVRLHVFTDFISYY